MIVSRPKFSTLFSLGIFLIIAYGLAIWSIASWPQTGDIPLYRYLLTGGVSLVALIVTLRVLGSYKTVRLNGDKWQVSYLLRPGRLRFKTSQISWWKVTTIKTRGGVYQELHLHNDAGRNVKLSPQEHTSYNRILNHLQKHCAKKRLKED